MLFCFPLGDVCPLATRHFHTPHKGGRLSPQINTGSGISLNICPDERVRLLNFVGLSLFFLVAATCHLQMMRPLWLSACCLSPIDRNKCPLKVKVLLTVASTIIHLHHLMLVPLCSPSAVTPGYRCLTGRLGIVLRRRTDGGERKWHSAIRPAVERCDWLVSKQRNIFCGKTCNSGAQQVEREDNFLFFFFHVHVFVPSCNEWKIYIFYVFFVLFSC